jgi:hypothetical protein
MKSSVKKLLILEDSIEDVVSLIRCEPIRKRFVSLYNYPINSLPVFSGPAKAKRGTKQNTGKEDPLDFLEKTGVIMLSDVKSTSSTLIDDIISKASIIVVQKLDDAIHLARNFKFDLIITDLFLFDPDFTNGPTHPKSLSGFPLEERCGQINSPSGLQFISDLRHAESTYHTPRDIPAIVMTFFWTHPRFERYIRKLDSFDPVVGYLPKYFKVENKRLRDETGDSSFEILIDLMLQKSEFTKRLVPLLFRGLSSELLLHDRKLKSHKALSDLYNSQHDFLRSIIDFTLSFELRGLSEPKNEMGEFQHIVANILNGSITAEVNYQFQVYNPETREYHLPPPSGTLLKLSGKEKRTQETAKKQFIILLALALYSYPLADQPHTFTNKDLASLMSKFDLRMEERDIVQSIHHLRRELQTALPREIFDFASVKNHILVSHGQSGYYLNAQYRISYIP